MSVTVSPATSRSSVPVVASCTRAPPKSPVGTPPPKTTIARAPGTTVPGGNVCRTIVESLSVQPLMSIAMSKLLMISTKSSWIALTMPSPLASPSTGSGSAWISLMTQRA